MKYINLFLKGMQDTITPAANELREKVMQVLIQMGIKKHHVFIQEIHEDEWKIEVFLESTLKPVHCHILFDAQQERYTVIKMKNENPKIKGNYNDLYDAIDALVELL